MKCFDFITSNLSFEPESAHDGDHNSVPVRPKWGGNLISLAINCLFRQYSCIILEHNQSRGGIITRPFDICRWNWRTWPPIRTSDISSWTYDKNSFFVNPARYERQWNKSFVDSTITDEVPWWKWWCNEANWSPGVLRCCFLESWLYYKFEHNRSIVRDVFDDMLEQMAYFWNRMDDYKIWLNDENAPLHVELSIFIESHFKFTIMSFKLIIRLNFGLKLQNFPGRPL